MSNPQQSLAASTRPRRHGVQRRVVSTLVVTQALGGVGVSAAVSVNALLAEDVSGSETMAGLAQTTQVLGSAIVAALLARLMVRFGRRPGLALGYLMGTSGAAVCITAGAVRNFPLLLIGAALLGSTTAANNQSRYAATDLAEPQHRGRDLSVVVWATTIGSVFGPNLTGPGGAVARWLHLPVLTGPFLFAAVGMLLAAGYMMWRLRPDPLLTARAWSAGGRSTSTPDVVLDPVADEPADLTGLRPGVSVALHVSVWHVIASNRLIVAATIGLALSQAAMVSVMVMTPIHMHHGDASLEIIGLVISVHVLGMYAFSPLVGWAVDRLGAAVVMAAGGGTLLLAMLLAGTSPMGASWGLGVGLFLLGLGWSFGTVAASTLLTAATPELHRPRVQGTTDMLTGFTAAAGGAVAGVLVGWLGFGWLALFAALLASGVIAVAALAGRQPGRPPVHPG